MPALVPIHKRSLQANSEVIRKQAALCCRIISSQASNKKNELRTCHKIISSHRDQAKKNLFMVNKFIPNHDYRGSNLRFDVCQEQKSTSEFFSTNEESNCQEEVTAELMQ